MRIHRLLGALCVLLFSAALAKGQSEPQFIYFSSGDRIMAYATGPDSVSVLLEGSDEDVAVDQFLGLNFGPDRRLYFCGIRFGEPDTGIVGYVYPDGTDPEIFYASEYDSTLTQPECGWFTHQGDFNVADQFDGEIFTFPGMAGLTSSFPEPLKAADADSTAGQITQYLNGDLLAVVYGGISRTIFPDFLPQVAPAAAESTFPEFIVLDEGTIANGIADSTGYIFVSADAEILRFDSTGAPKGEGACADFGGYEDEPGHLASAIDSKLFAALQSGRIAEMVFDADSGECQEEILVDIYREEEDYPANCGGGEEYCPVTGIAVTETSAEKSLDWESNQAGSSTFVATFDGSNQARLRADSTCEAAINATLTPCSDVATAIGEIVDPLVDLSNADPVAYFGDNGFCYTYETLGLATTDGYCDPYDEPECTCPGYGPSGLYELRVDMFAFPSIYRIGVCEEFLPDGEACEVWAHSFNVPDVPDWLLTTDPPVGGKRSRGSTSFVIEAQLDPAGSGLSCGFRPPLTNSMAPFSEEPIVGTIGSTIPVKTRLPVVGGNCNKGKWDKNATVMLSVVAVTEEAPYFWPVDVYNRGVGTIDEFGRAILKSGTQYQFNWDTSGLEPGIYLLTIDFLTLEAPPFSTEVILVE